MKTRNIFPNKIFDFPLASFFFKVSRISVLLVMIGFAGNQFVQYANGGKMPVICPDHLLSCVKNTTKHFRAHESSNFLFFSDWIVKSWLEDQGAIAYGIFSPGPFASASIVLSVVCVAVKR